MNGETRITSLKSDRFSTRALLTFVVLGALGAIIVHVSRILGVALQATVPWLAFPAPVPWFLGILIAALLIQRSGAALLTSIVTTVAGFGALALCAGIVIELTFFITRRLRSQTQPTWPPARSQFWLWWAILACAIVSLMSFGFMFFYQEFLLLDPSIKLLALIIRVGLGVLYGWGAWVMTIGLLRANVNPQRIVVA
ncbi:MULTISPECIES: ABC transporter permease [Actinomycetes]|uniref:ECF transporter S component n=3 Tax=Actinomycetes TaxID=1760 RepID=A0A2H1KS26_BREAU|nr:MULTISPECIES: hypothetical protein [Actinomycetes]MDN5704272.1 hypothetical protein [Yaniella sp.]AHI21392.1 hypothetical protein CCASEI_14348 [Corynebacterium casei LMG S-19264]MDA3146015.1 hypothetical protein [Leucobacter sp. UCMA 4100]MDN6281498.1 hypothetical protein [Corynebacterium sp.]MDN6305022.1 hypothetical protein [Corynebacterium sp.]